MLERFRRDRNHLTDLALKSPELLETQFWQVLSSDPECQCGVGTKEAQSRARCPMCRNIGRLTTLSENTLKLPFAIECGREEGKKLSLMQFPRVQPSVKLTERSNYIARHILAKCSGYASCEPDVLKHQDIGYYALDEFTNGALASFLLERILSQDRLDRHIIKVYQAFICGKDGYYLQEGVTGHNLDQITWTPELARGVARQLLLVLYKLAPYNFTHGHPHYLSLYLDQKPLYEKYGQLTVASPYTLKLTRFGNSALSTSYHSRFFASSPYTESYLGKAIHLPQIVTEKKGKVHYYKLNKEISTFFLQLRYGGVPLYPHSFDYYSFMVSLMSLPDFRESFKDDMLWKAMWTPEDHVEVMKRLEARGPLPDVDAVVEVLRGLHLRCDLVPYLISLY